MAVHITLAAAFMVGCNSVLPESQWPIHEMISQAIAVAMSSIVTPVFSSSRRKGEKNKNKSLSQ
jgi:membrane protein implicated in regulation of membrane protease activity